jgi:UMF1 family MFS transporter
VTLFLGPYLTALAKAGSDGAGRIYPLGIGIDARAYWGYLVALSVAFQVIALPVIGALADYTGRKRMLLAACAYPGAAATIAMSKLQGQDYLLGGALFLFANVAFGASIVVYNAFLPDIAAPEERDAVSSKGWGIGYLGGGILLALNLLLYQSAGALHITEGMAVRISLGSAGVWWAVFTIIPLRALRDRPSRLTKDPGHSVLSAGFRQMFHTLRDLRRFPQTLKFLAAYLLYNDAIQTVIALASQFGHEELKIPLGTLTLVILMVQFVAFFGALAFGRIAKWLGARNAVELSLAVWTGVILCIYFAVRTTAGFFAMGAVVGVVLGGSQALSRSLFSRMIPAGREAEYFSIYEIGDKGTSWLCPLLFGLALDYTGNYRMAILSLVVFFIAGMVVLWRVDVAEAYRASSSTRGDSPGDGSTGLKTPSSGQ